jgi:hypothetical protein
VAKTPKKPDDGKPAKAKPADAKTQKPAAKKVNKAVGVETLDAGEREVYKAKEKDIDLALSRCVSHFRKLQPSEVRVVIKLLTDNYRKYGGHNTSGGIKVKK